MSWWNWLLPCPSGYKLQVQRWLFGWEVQNGISYCSCNGQRWPILMHPTCWCNLMSVRTSTILCPVVAIAVTVNSPICTQAAKLRNKTWRCCWCWTVTLLMIFSPSQSCYTFSSSQKWILRIQKPHKRVIWLHSMTNSCKGTITKIPGRVVGNKAELVLRPHVTMTTVANAILDFHLNQNNYETIFALTNHNYTVTPCNPKKNVRNILCTQKKTIKESFYDKWLQRKF